MSEPTPGPVDEGDRSPTHQSRRVVGTLLAIAAAVIGLDLLTKTLAVNLLDPGQPVRIIGDAVTLRLVRNSGAAFSMASGYTWVLTIVALLVVLGIIRYSSRLRSMWWVLGLGLVLGGAMGNLADRRATTIDGDRPHPLIDRAERVAWAQPWVRHAGARVRDEGHVVHVEMFVVPHEGAGATVGRCAQLREEIVALDWKLEDVVVVPVAQLPAEVHGGASGDEQSGEE